MASKRKQTDSDLIGEDELRQLEQRAIPKSLSGHNAELTKLSQSGLRPVYLRVWSRSDITSRVMHDCPPPFRRGEPALVVGPAHSMQMGDHEEPVFTIEYGDTINKDFPQTVALPVECYIWTYMASDIVGMSYCERRNKRKF